MVKQLKGQWLMTSNQTVAIQGNGLMENSFVCYKLSSFIVCNSMPGASCTWYPLQPSQEKMWISKTKKKHTKKIDWTHNANRENSGERTFTTPLNTFDQNLLSKAFNSVREDQRILLSAINLPLHCHLPRFPAPLFLPLHHLMSLPVSWSVSRWAEQGNNLLHHGNHGEEGYEERQREMRTDGSGNNRQEEKEEREVTDVAGRRSNAEGGCS